MKPEVENKLRRTLLEKGCTKYLKECINEALRIDPPVRLSSTLELTEDTHIGKY